MTRRFGVQAGRSLAREEEDTMESTGHRAAGVAGQTSDTERQLLRGLVDYLRQKRPELRQGGASRITDAPLLRGMRTGEIFTGGTAGFGQHTQAPETRPGGAPPAPA